MCQTPAKAIDFIYDPNMDSYDLSSLKTDEELLMKIQGGKSANKIYHNTDGIVKIEQLFGGYSPENLY